jgi:tetratricopeptide (TPR) repeat protein
MAGGIDVYQMCPCGSDRKLKFCCHAIVNEMIKVTELQESHQHHAALTLLDSIEKKVKPREQWSRAWVKTSQAFLKFALEDYAAARKLTEEVLEELPEHPLAVAVHAILAVSGDGYPAAMRSVYRAFQFSLESQPFVLSHLSVILSRQMRAKGQLMAAICHLRMAMNLANDNKEAIEEFKELMMDPRIPYPLRDIYGLQPIPADDPLAPQFAQAVDLARIGRFSDAAKAFGSLARQAPQRTTLWWNIGLCHAWAGEDPLAAGAFKAAAADETDFETAVDCLLLSRLLKPAAGASKTPGFVSRYSVAAVSRLLTRFDEHPQMFRDESHREDVGDDLGENLAAVYRILDRDPHAIPAAELTADNLPHILGELIVFDRIEGQPGSFAFLTTYGMERHAVCRQVIETAGELIRPAGEPAEQGYSRTEHLPMMLNWYMPRELSKTRILELRREAARRIVSEIWPAIPQESLGGKTPLEAAQIPEMKLELATAVLEFEVFCEANAVAVDQAAVRDRLGLPAVTYTEIQSAPDSERSFNPTLLAIRHYDVSNLEDGRIYQSAELALRLGHLPLMCKFMNEALGRPALAEKIDVAQISMIISRNLAKRLDFENAMIWVERGRAAALAAKKPLTEIAMWEIHELMLRSHNPEDPRIAEISDKLWNYYLPKLPEARDVIIGVLNELELDGPWSSPIQQSFNVDEPLAEAAVAAPSGWWTPKGETAAQPSKLWLPGQE